MNTTAYACAGCRKHFSASELRYDHDGAHLLCATCRTSLTSKQSELQRLSAFAAQKPLQGKVPQKIGEATARPARYHCHVCNYAFIRSTNKETICPSCSRKAAAESVHKEAEPVRKETELMQEANSDGESSRD